MKKLEMVSDDKHVVFDMSKLPEVSIFVEKTSAVPPTISDCQNLMYLRIGDESYKVQIMSRRYFYQEYGDGPAIQLTECDRLNTVAVSKKDFKKIRNCKNYEKAIIEFVSGE